MHGDKNEMGRLRQALVDKYQNQGVTVFTPKNCVTVQMTFKTEKMCRVVGSLASEYQNIVLAEEERQQQQQQQQQQEKDLAAPSSPTETTEAETTTVDEKSKIEQPTATARPTETPTIHGVLVIKDFERTLVSTKDLYQLTHLPITHITQRVKVPCSAKFSVVEAHLRQVYDDIKEVLKDDKPALCIFNSVYVISNSPKDVILDWSSTPTNDMIADSIIALLSHCETNPFADQLGTNIVTCLDLNYDGYYLFVATNSNWPTISLYSKHNNYNQI